MRTPVMPSNAQRWARTPGLTKMADRVCHILTDPEEGTVWVDGALSWRDDFRDFIRGEIYNTDSRLNIEFVDAEELPEPGDPADLIFSYDESARGKYLPAKNLADFVKEEGVLSSWIIWLYHVDVGRDSAWIELSGGLARRGAGLKVVCEGISLPGQSPKNATLFRQADYVSPFDYLLFAMTLVQEAKWSSELKLYACRLTLSLAEDSAESIAGLLDQPDTLVRDPRACAEEAGLDIPPAELDRMIHTAQLISLLPKVELLRSRFIEENREALGVLVPFEDNYGIRIEKVEDMELRHIFFYCEITGKVRLDREAGETLHFLYDLRNDLAHRKIVEGDRAIECLSR